MTPYSGICKVCEKPIALPVYNSDGDLSITSLCNLYEGRIAVYFCQHCGHLQTNEIKAIQNYYDKSYDILMNSEDEDDLYEVRNHVNVFRFDHQAQTLLKKTNFSTEAKILDYGCAKATTFKKVLKTRPDLSIYLYDVSGKYLRFWQEFVNESRWAIYDLKPEWKGLFDGVTCFFSLEHIGRPREALRMIYGVLKPGGILYVLVPNCYTNSADMLVVDHVNHFSKISLQYLFESSGFSLDSIDDLSHQSAWIAVGKKIDSAPKSADIDISQVRLLSKTVAQTISHWVNLKEKIREFEKKHSKTTKVAIYGAGFYGIFIATGLKDMSKVECFIDQNPYRQGKQLFGKPVIAPQQLSPEVQTIYIGLNPLYAAAVIDQIIDLKIKKYEYFFI